VFAVMAWETGGAPWWVGPFLAVIAVVFGGGAALYWHATLRGKFLVWARVLDALPADDYPRILDLGCGRGAVAIQAALRAPSSRVVGLDLWRTVDFWGISPQVARSNAEANGVADRIQFTTGDMTDLPWPDCSFDLVTASLAIHTIPTHAGGAKAVSEAWRVLAAGGSLVIVENQRTGEYLSALHACTAQVIRPEHPGGRTRWLGPWAMTAILRASKLPPGAAPDAPAAGELLRPHREAGSAEVDHPPPVSAHSAAPPATTHTPWYERLGPIPSGVFCVVTGPIVIAAGIASLIHPAAFATNWLESLLWVCSGLVGTYWGIRLIQRGARARRRDLTIRCGRE
jgi:arsenite methyltransferase